MDYTHESKKPVSSTVVLNLSLEVNEQPFLRALGRLAFTEYDDLTPFLKYNLQPYQKVPQ